MVLKSLDKTLSQLSPALSSHTYSPYCLKVKVCYHNADPFDAKFPQFHYRSVFSVCIPRNENLAISELACVCLWYFLFTYILISITLKCASYSQSRDSARWITGEHQENHQSPNIIYADTGRLYSFPHCLLLFSSSLPLLTALFPNSPF